METELHHFFLTVANYPLSGNIDKYLATLNTRTITSQKNKSEMWFRARAIFIIGQFKSLSGRTKSVSKDDNHGVSLFADQDVVTFEKQRNILIKALEHVISDQGIEKSGDFTRCIVIANKLEPTLNFICTSEDGGETKVVKTAMKITEIEKDKTPELVLLEDIFNLVCYSLISFLASNDRRKIKKCPYCEMFFIAKDTKRKKCYEAICKNKYHKKDMQLRREKDPVKYC
jgi:hypothetical protein